MQRSWGIYHQVVKINAGLTSLQRSDRELGAGYPVDIIYLSQFIGTDIQDPGLVGTDGGWVVPPHGRKYDRCTGAKLCLRS